MFDSEFRIPVMTLENLFKVSSKSGDFEQRLTSTAPLRKTAVIGWVALAESHPKPESELIMYREDAGVFFGYYGSLEESVPEDQKENLYEQGLTEEDMFENRFYYYDMAGNGLLELETLPQFWAECPKPPCL